MPPVVRGTYQGRPIAPARKRFSGSIDSHASMKESQNSGLVTWLSKLPRQPGHEPGVLRLLHRGVRVDGPAEPLPGGSDRPPLVGPANNGWHHIGACVLIIGRETIHNDSATFMPQRPNTCAGRRRTDGEWSTGGLERTAAGGLAVVCDHGSA